ncbi:hypothetical protein Clacol_005824 [Clathrus columnatus]|uniref:Uncharacterized protein n=1 Tax=Clathrus columnatus TaxID=1419009 RepID=A0AAV5AFX7_9AGAM|nr:hypothetical protein Clacol_005824 [Clathrus columnatus]
MFSGDTLDFELFGIPNTSNDFTTLPFEEFEDPVTGFAPHTLPLPLHVDFLGIDEIIDRGTSSNADTGSTSQNVDRLQDASFASQPKHSSNPNSGFNLQNIANTNVTQPSTSILLNSTAGLNVSAVQPLPPTASSLQNTNASLEGSTGPTTERQRLPPSSPHRGSCLTAPSKPPLNLDWNSIHLSLGLTGWDTYDSDAATNDPSYASVSSNGQTTVELPPTNDAFDTFQFCDFNNGSGSSDTQSAVSPANNNAFDATELLYSNADSTPCINNTQSAELQPSNYVFNLTEPEYFPSPSPLQRHTHSWNIEQQMPTNVTQPSAVAPQHFPVPNATPIPSYTQPTNSVASPAIQPQNHSLKPSFSLENKRQLVFPNSAQPSTSSIQHSLPPGINENTSSLSHSRQPTQVPASQASSQSPVKQASQAKQRRVMNMPPPQSTPAANAPHQYYPIPSPNENTPIHSQSRPNQAPVNNLNPAFFSTPPQHGFNSGVQSHNTSQRSATNVPPQPSTASLSNVARQSMEGSAPISQRQGPVNMPLNRHTMARGPGNVPQNLANFPLSSNPVVPNFQHTARQPVLAGLNSDPRAPQIQSALDNPSVANNQRLTSPNKISTTGYNGNAIVTNNAVPPTSGVPNVDPSRQQLSCPTPSPHTAVAQGGPDQPPFNNPHPHPIFPLFRKMPGVAHPVPIPIPTPQPIIHPWTQQPVYTVPPSASKSQLTSSASMPPPSTSDLVVTRPRKKRPRPKDDDEPVANNSQKRSRGERPADYLYEEIKKGKYACRYAGPAQPGGCKAPTFTSISSLSTHIMLIHAKLEGEMNLPLEQRSAYNGLPPSLRSAHVVCPLPDAELTRCKHYRERGQRWEAHVMDTPEHAVHLHMTSDHA